MALSLFGDFGFVGGSDETTARYQDAQRCINFYPEVSPSPVAKAVVALLGTPGLAYIGGPGQNPLIWTADSGIPIDSPGLTADGLIQYLSQWPLPAAVTNLPVRGVWVLPGRTQALAVIGNTCYLVTQSGGALLTMPVGTLLTRSGPVCIRDNGIQGGAAVIVDGPYGYLYQLSGLPLSLTVLGNVTPGSAIVSCESTIGLVVGAAVSDSDGLLPSDTTLIAVDINASTFTLSNPISGSPISVASTSASGTAATLAITKISVSAGSHTMTVEFAAQSSAPAAGSSVSIAGVVPSVYNGSYGVVSAGVNYVVLNTPNSSQVSQLGSILVMGTSTLGFPTQATAPPVGGNVTVGAMNPSTYEGTYTITASTTSSVSFNSFGSGSQTSPGQLSWGETLASDTFTMTTPVFTQILDPAFLGADTVAYIDGWWIFNDPGTALFYSNSSAYSLAFNGSYYAYKDAFSDALMAVIEIKEELWLLGEQTTEIWYNAGGTFFPFQRLVGTLLQMGCAAKHSVCQLSQGGTDSLIWLGRNIQGENVIVRTSGFSWEVVSTPAVSNAIAQYSSVSDCVAYVYQDGTHEFAVFNFPTADRTWVYDSTLPPHLAWHERLSWDPYASQWHRHRSNCYMNFAGMRVVGDYQNGCLYEMTRSVYTDCGWPIRAVRRSPYVWNAESRERVFMQQLQIDFQLGQGAAAGLGSNPQARLRISRDYGATYGSALTAPMGAQGQYTNRCIWRRLGFSRGAVLEVEVIDPVNRDIAGATLRALGP